MCKLNNKGQVLVLFILFIPLFIFFFSIVYDVSSLANSKNEMSNINYLAVSYYLDDNDFDIEKFISDNLLGIKKIDVIKEENNIKLCILKDYNGIFKIKNINLISCYKGNNDRTKKNIERVK